MLRTSLDLKPNQGTFVTMQKADAVVSSVEKLGQILGVDAQVAQSLVTTDPRYQLGSSPARAQHLGDSRKAPALWAMAHTH